jgi:hypothetical protein
MKKESNSGQIDQNIRVSSYMEKNMEMASWSGKIKAHTRVIGEMERCKAQDFRRFQMVKFMMANMTTINSTDQENACTVTVKYKKENSRKENTTVKEAKHTLTYLECRSYNRYKI